MAPQRDPRRPHHLHPLGLRRPLRLHGPHAVDHDARRPRLPGTCTATSPRGSSRPDMELDIRAIPGSHKLRGHRRPAPWPGLRLAGGDRSARGRRRRHGPRRSGSRPTSVSPRARAARGLRHRLAAERGLLPVRLRRRHGDRAEAGRRGRGQLRDLPGRLLRATRSCSTATPRSAARARSRLRATPRPPAAPDAGPPPPGQQPGRAAQTARAAPGRRRSPC